MFLNLLTIVALLVISFTMLVRAHHTGLQPGVRLHMRRLGLVFAGFGAAGVALTILAGADPRFYWAAYAIGTMCVFLTSPELPPWWRFWEWLNPVPQVPPLPTTPGNPGPGGGGEGTPGPHRPPGDLP